MAAATFVSSAPLEPDGKAGYPQFLPITIVAVAVGVLVVANATLGKSPFWNPHERRV